MANDEVLGPRKTMFVLVIVVGCFAVLWPRILSPLILGHTSEQLKPNKFDRETAIKQERSPIRMGPHPALLERGRAIPPGPPPPARPVVLPPHVRVRSPLSVYYDFEIKPPPIPGMRPPLGSPGGPVPAPKSSMGFVMPIYTICIIVFFVYTLSKILFKRTGVPYDPVTPDPQFRRRVFRDDSRTSPDRLGHKETDTIVSAISGLVAEVRQQMEASNTQNQQRQEVLDNARPFTNGNLLFNSSPVKIVACEYIEPPITTVEQKDNELSLKKSDLDLEISGVEKEDNVVRPKSAKKEKTDDEYPTTWCGDDEVPVIEPDTPDSPSVESMDPVVVKVVEDAVPSSKIKDNVEEFATKPKNAEIIKSTPEDETNAEEKEESDTFLELFQISDGTESSAGDNVTKLSDDSVNEEEERREPLTLAELVDYHRMQNAETKDNTENQSVKVVGMEMTAHPADGGAWRENPPRAAPQPAPHKADVVKSIFLETEIPQQSRVLVSEFAEDRTNKPKPSKHAPLVVSGKMTLSLIQDAPRDTPDRDLESTFDDYTTASGLTQPAAERDDLSDEEIEEEIEIEEIEEIEESEEDEVIEPEGIEKK